MIKNPKTVSLATACDRAGCGHAYNWHTPGNQCTVVDTGGAYCPCMTFVAPLDYDGCSPACRRAGEHTLTWGQCEHAPAPKPEPTVSMSAVFQSADGYNSIGYDTYTSQQLADLIEPALRAVQVRFGPNALAMLQRGETVGLSGGEYADLARTAADAIIHRNDKEKS